jgi:hypothetical protein
MSMNFKTDGFVKIFGSLFLIVLIAFFCLGLRGYSGNKVLYTVFTLVSAWMLISAFRQFKGYGYLFLAVFLWLGFWLKLTLHLILNYSFIEPVGMFSGNSAQLDQALVVVTVAFIGLSLGKSVFSVILSKDRSKPNENYSSSSYPAWYPKYRRLIWTALVLVSALIIYVNLKFGIHLIGMLPRTILMWPLNSLIAWALNIGLATAVTTMAWWDIQLGRNSSPSVFAIILEALCSSVAVMSRAMYIFHSLPPLFALGRTGYIARLAVWKKMLLGILFLTFLVASIAAVSTLRNYLYQSPDAYSSTRYQVAYARWEVATSTIYVLEKSLPSVVVSERAKIKEKIEALRIEVAQLVKILEEEKMKFRQANLQESRQTSFLMNEFGYQLQGGFATQIMHLSVDRWIGLEGLLAVVSYPEKSMNLFLHALTDKPVVGKPDIYQTISQSIYLKANMEIFKFASLPGAVGFLFYSNSYAVVALGMFIFSFLILALEKAVGFLTRNPLLASLYGAAVASMIAQFGVQPRSSLAYCLMLAIGVLGVAALQVKFSSINKYIRQKRNTAGT